MDASILPRIDCFRRSPSRLGGGARHKEWQHFLVHAEGLQLLVNFNLLDDPWAADPRRVEVARVIALARAEGWLGGMERFSEHEVHVVPGQLDARFGPNTLRFVHDRYLLSVALRSPALSAELELVPITEPALYADRPLSPEERLSWLLVPRLRARGTVRLGERTLRVEDAPAYHDHNWGHFRWGSDFTWEWASALPRDPTNPWCAVFTRVADRGRTRLRFQLLSLWHGARLRRTFRNRELSVTREGCFQPEQSLRLPPVMALLAPGRAQDLPERLEISARAGGDEVRLRFAPGHLAQLLVPSEADLRGVVALNEVSGAFELGGRIDGVAAELEGPGVFELVRD